MEDVLRKKLSHASSSSGRGAPTKGFSKRMLEVRSCTSWVTAGPAGAVWLEYFLLSAHRYAGAVMNAT
jgi:hypothetical protein